VASFIVVEVGGTSTFVTHDVTKVEVRWAETHLKLKSHASKERGGLIPRTSAGLSCPGLALPAQARAGPGLGPAGQGWGLALALVMALVMAVAVVPKF
jgi:hypothetical protein